MIRVPARKIQRYGWKPDLPDHRDFMFVSQLPAAVPPSVDMRNGCSKVEDQGNLGSCTGNASVGALEFLEKKADPTPTNLSRLFAYYNARALEGTQDEDSGASIRDVVRGLAKYGVPTEKNWPYKISMFASRPGDHTYSLALAHKITKYNRINALSDMKACLADGYPFIFGFSVYDGFESQQTAESGVVGMPKPSEQLLGGHAVLAVGYADNDTLPQAGFTGVAAGSGGGYFIVRNSWGTGWGLRGYFLFPYAYATDRNLSDDFWTIRK